MFDFSYEWHNVLMDRINNKLVLILLSAFFIAEPLRANAVAPTPKTFSLLENNVQYEQNEHVSNSQSQMPVVKNTLFEKLNRTQTADKPTLVPDRNVLMLQNHQTKPAQEPVQIKNDTEHKPVENKPLEPQKVEPKKENQVQTQSKPLKFNAAEQKTSEQSEKLKKPAAEEKNTMPDTNEAEPAQSKSVNSQKMTPDKIDEMQDIRNNAKLLYNSNKPEEAQAAFSQIPDAEKISDDWVYLANISQDFGKNEDAVFYLKKAIMADDGNYKAHYNLGNLYLADDKTSMALSEYNKAIKNKKDFAYAHYNKGCAYLKRNSWYNAKYEFGLAIKADPYVPSFYYNLAYTYKMMNKTKKAQEALDMYEKLMTN